MIYLEKNEHAPWNLLEPRKGRQAGASVCDHCEREEEESSSAFTMSPFCMVEMGGWRGGGGVLPRRSSILPSPPRKARKAVNQNSASFELLNVAELSTK